MINLKELISPSLQYHIDNGLSLHENIYRYGSDAFVELFAEARRALANRSINLSEQDRFLLETTDIGEYGEYEGERVPLDLPLIEAEYQGRDVKLNKPKRGGPKKFQVYVRNPKTGKIVKVNFGAAGGGQNLSVKLDDPKRRKAFADRHNCDQKKDKTKPGYWSCRITYYWKSLGGSKNYSGYW